ncbi:hypothetical protein R1sor_003129 [Riccia sorocarpa]|uniref:Sec-independent protein translocase protein TatA n=1 Tax=Riccia sorocarpa TaxID=122646 RepID=A0ABD3H3E5_9MARC
MPTMAVASCSLGVATAGPAMAATRSTAIRGPEFCSCRSAAPCSSFLGAEVHASALSPVFEQQRASIRRSTIQHRRLRRGSQNLVVRGLFGLGVPELVVIAGVAAILFGPKKLPEIGKSLGKTVKSFQQAAKEFESEIKNPPAETPGTTETSNVEKPPSSAASSTYKDSARPNHRAQAGEARRESSQGGTETRQPDSPAEQKLVKSEDELAMWKQGSAEYDDDDIPIVDMEQLQLLEDPDQAADDLLDCGYAIAKTPKERGKIKVEQDHTATDDREEWGDYVSYVVVEGIVRRTDCIEKTDKESLPASGHLSRTT